MSSSGESEAPSKVVFVARTKPCEHCENGYCEVMKDCGKPSSDCCGGCTKKEKCDICNGSGEIVVEPFDDEYRDLLTDEERDFYDEM